MELTPKCHSEEEHCATQKLISLIKDIGYVLEKVLDTMVGRLIEIIRHGFGFGFGSFSIRSVGVLNIVIPSLEMSLIIRYILGCFTGKIVVSRVSKFYKSYLGWGM